MLLLLILGIVAIVAILGTFVEVARDGYRARPTISASDARRPLAGGGWKP